MEQLLAYMILTSVFIFILVPALGYTYTNHNWPLGYFSYTEKMFYGWITLGLIVLFLSVIACILWALNVLIY